MKKLTVNVFKYVVKVNKGEALIRKSTGWNEMEPCVYGKTKNQRAESPTRKIDLDNAKDTVVGNYVTLFQS
ncbi:MAG: hypothetical protein K9I68_03010 [Bacteroidales bacterium]|nr:hypothetical protein [Bacteroidales bacterium]MCF8336691.1 hypothetical protein [Bacteroidales bacterium]